MVLRVGTHIDKEEDRSDRCRHIPWNEGSEIGWLLILKNLECDNSNLKIYSVANFSWNIDDCLIIMDSLKLEVGSSMSIFMTARKQPFRPVLLAWMICTRS